MIHPNGHDPSTATIPAPVRNETIQARPEMPPPGQPLDIATRAKLRARQHFQQNRFVIIGAGALVVALLVFVATSIPHKSPVQKTKVGASAAKEEPTQMANAGADRSLFPITDSGRPSAKEAHEGFLNEKDLERSVTHRSHPGSAQAGPSNAPGSLGSIPPFGPDQPGWQAPPYQAGAAPTAVDGTDLGKAEREAMEKSSLIYVRNVSGSGVNPQTRERTSVDTPEIGLGLSTGTRLRARLESAASTAVRAPVLAVVEYTYERNGQIIVPAGAKAVGRIQEADRSGYVRIQFESLMMPDGATVPIQAVATDLDMRPLKGKVEGKNTGKNILVRSLSGIGQAGALMLGQGSLNQPLSESDLMRERLSNNIGEASDEEISRMAITSRIVVTVSADTPIYVVLERTANGQGTSGLAGPRSSQSLNSDTEELRQLLQLKRELNQASSAPQ
ncbi:MAG TPA: TrbI/VirB10 family protein [Terriglobales bacterium]|nr:TrbI/VirB10 family protein [Terriglobales bacterium]